MEAVLAYSLRLPLLIIHHNGIRRGIFDRGAISAFLYEIDMIDPSWPMQKSTHGALMKWKTDCIAQPLPASANQTVAENTQACPNCSSADRPFRMSPIGSVFQDIAGGRWECSRCKLVM